MRGINRQPKKVIRVSQIEFVESESDDEDVSFIYSYSSLLDFFESFGSGQFFELNNFCPSFSGIRLGIGKRFFSSYF